MSFSEKLALGFVLIWIGSLAWLAWKLRGDDDSRFESVDELAQRRLHNRQEELRKAGRAS